MRPDRLVVGECRGAEVVDLLGALNTGHEGGAGTLHANTPADVPARLEALGLLGGLPRAALHAQVAAALQVVLQVRRTGGRPAARSGLPAAAERPGSAGNRGARLDARARRRTGGRVPWPGCSSTGTCRCPRCCTAAPHAGDRRRPATPEAAREPAPWCPHRVRAGRPAPAPAEPRGAAADRFAGRQGRGTPGRGESPVTGGWSAAARLASRRWPRLDRAGYAGTRSPPAGARRPCRAGVDRRAVAAAPTGAAGASRRRSARRSPAWSPRWRLLLAGLVGRGRAARPTARWPPGRCSAAGPAGDAGRSPRRAARRTRALAADLRAGLPGTGAGPCAECRVAGPPIASPG